MKTVSKDKLRKIIQEELEKEAIDEGFIHTMQAAGDEIVDFFKRARKKGDIVAGDQETRRAAYRTAKSLEGELQRLIKICGPKGEKCSQKAKNQMASFKSTIEALRNSPDAAVEVMADASDGSLDKDELSPQAQALLAKEKETATAPATTTSAPTTGGTGRTRRGRSKSTVAQAEQKPETQTSKPKKSEMDLVRGRLTKLEQEVANLVRSQMNEAKLGKTSK